ncbi:MAG: hypothetical protein IJ315_06320 [Firmicutes bacterium]|nr:hypothetical protein [Bacillota bacterium]
MMNAKEMLNGMMISRGTQDWLYVAKKELIVPEKKIILMGDVAKEIVVEDKAKNFYFGEKGGWA